MADSRIKLTILRSETQENWQDTGRSMDNTTHVPERTLNNGLKIPCLGYGVYKAAGDELKKALTYALGQGYRLIDTASFYENETIVGDVVKTCGVLREEVFITSKLWPTEFRDPVTALENSLRRLQTDYLDAYLLHWPGLDEKLRLATYEKLLLEQEKGRIRALGVSNFLQVHLVQLHDTFKTWPVINQIEIQPLFQQKDLCSFCKDNHIQIMSWSPLGRGAALEIPQIKEIAMASCHTPAQVILRWQTQIGLIPLPKSIHENRIRENYRIFNFKLTPAQITKINCLELPDLAGRIGKDPLVWPPMD